MARWLRIRNVHELDSVAREFREQYIPGWIGPVDIEMIAECDLGIEIVPLEGLTRRTGNKAWLSANGRTICVDTGVQRDHPELYRMSVAHEVAHHELHSDLLPVPGFRRQADFTQFHLGLSEWKLNCLEAEACELAGRILVPRTELRLVFHHELAKVVDMVGSEARTYAGHHLVEDLVAAHFGVSQPCMEICLRRDDLWSEARRRGWFGEPAERKFVLFG